MPLLPRRAFLAAPLAPLALAAEQRKSLKITGLETDLNIAPPRKPTYDALQALGVHSGTVTLRLKTDAGITGWATSNFGAVEGGPKVLRAILEEEVKPLILNQDPRRSAPIFTAACNIRASPGLLSSPSPPRILPCGTFWANMPASRCGG